MSKPTWEDLDNERFERLQKIAAEEMEAEYGEARNYPEKPEEMVVMLTAQLYRYLVGSKNETKLTSVPYEAWCELTITDMVELLKLARRGLEK